MAPAVAQALEGVRPQAEAKGLVLTSQVAPALPPLPADPLRLGQILMNLLSNAVKFTPAGGRVTVHATGVPDADAPAWVEIRIEDTGVGIAPESLARLFQKFEQLDASMAKRHEGTGLGLALTRHLVEIHGGTIAAQSAGIGQGTTFTVRLPAGAARTSPLVLLVEDDPLLREVLTEQARAWGWQITAAGTLVEARGLMAAGRPDLFILDDRLPDGSGIDLAHQLRQGTAPRIPIIVYTGLGATESQRALAAGADDFLVKPAAPEELRRRAERILARSGKPLAASEAA